MYINLLQLHNVSFTHGFINDFDSYIFADGKGYYKYMWWGLQRDAETYDFTALGNHGQLIYIVPHKNLIILRFGETYGEYGGSQGWLELFYGFASEWD